MSGGCQRAAGARRARADALLLPARVAAGSTERGIWQPCLLCSTSVASLASQGIRDTPCTRRAAQSARRCAWSAPARRARQHGPARVVVATPRPNWQAAEWAELLARALHALAAAPGNRPAILDAGALPDLCAALAVPAAAPAAAETLALLTVDVRLAALPAPPLRALLALLGARGAQAAGTGGDGGGPGTDGAGDGGADETAAAAAAAARALAQVMRSAPNRQAHAVGRCYRGGLRQSSRC